MTNERLYNSARFGLYLWCTLCSTGQRTAHPPKNQINLDCGGSRLTLKKSSTDPTIAYASATPGCQQLHLHDHREEPRCSRQSVRHSPGGGNSRPGNVTAHCRLRLVCFRHDGWECTGCGLEPAFVRDFGQFELGTPLLGKVLARLREWRNKAQRRLHANDQIRIERHPGLRRLISPVKTSGHALA